MLFLAWRHTTPNSRIETNCAARCAVTSRLSGLAVVGRMWNDRASGLFEFNRGCLVTPKSWSHPWPDTCLLFVFSLRPGGVLLVSVQGIAVNVDPVFCTWLLYQPHRGSSRQQQQVSDHSQRFHMPHRLFDSKEIPESCLTRFFFQQKLEVNAPPPLSTLAPFHSPPFPKKKKKTPQTFYLLPFCIWSAPCLPSSHSLFIWQGSWWWLWTLSALCPHHIPTCMCSVWLPEI